MLINPSNPTRAEIAASFTLWGVFVDTSGLDTRERFDAMTEADKLAFMDDCFGPETPVTTCRECGSESDSHDYEACEAK